MIDEALLDDPAGLEAGDPLGVLRALAGAGAQVRRATDHALESGIAKLDPSDRPRAVLVAARGGSEVVADAVTALAGAASPVPIISRTGDVLPGWVGPLDMVVSVSLSGSQSPAIPVVAEAGRRGARVLTVSREGSALARVSQQVRGLHVETPSPGRDAVAVPTTRTALWSLLTPVLLAFDRLGLLSAGPSELTALADALDEEARENRPSSDTFVNPAKTLAVELDGSVPVVLGDGPVSAVAARRAATVLARSARVPALAGTLPDDAGDVVATFGGPFATTPDDVFADPFLDGPGGPKLRLMLLREHEAPASSAVVSIAERAGVRVSQVSVDGETPLQRLGLLIARTDFAATYLALGSGTDPGSSPHVADLRDSLR
ncbi:Fructoselysine-6-P-deglycase FrlB with duplicated sugar isomerase (SIS) domain [Quadrisphaera granulorum]|uniref:Fructoselysine-6-P-deglycase FrlB-like protein n=1 Tax=Quadrisphaera granulorum TaxID=317664 RepID=A0A316AC02_9ACTN|nr:SIS domain-containing protein [Quadrisphaera granulorum]PWJ54798.1 fructoselysine-6-P-deglycase FrlB-like protein [Quadrisphaera granulorum]SZE95744.1 Fructoselysine-6-P-deglycase FrlB with duplicated sugar isomerase (SIS) domain [Quadrisphaera granulorum]